MAEYNKPLPQITPLSEPFYKAAREHKLLVQRCKDCSQYVFYPKKFCPHCLSDNLEWVQSSGKGKVYSYTICRSNVPAAFVGDVPYVVAIVELSEGLWMLTNIVGCNPDDVKCDMPVEVAFEDVTDTIALPKFKLVAA